MIRRPLRRTLLGVACGLLVLSGCAADGDRLPTCDGRHKRPANPYGSALSDEATSPPSPMGHTSGSPIAPSKSVSPPQAGASQGACGGISR